MHLQVMFESFGGAKIDLDSVKVTYLEPQCRFDAAHKTICAERRHRYPDVELPLGEHMVRIDLKDSDGRIGSTSFVLKVAP